MGREARVVKPRRCPWCPRDISWKERSAKELKEHCEKSHPEHHD